MRRVFHRRMFPSLPPSVSKWGVVLCSPNDGRVVRKFVCHNEKSATIRGRIWKRRHPDCVVRIFSLLSGDTSAGCEIGLVTIRRGS